MRCCAAHGYPAARRLQDQTRNSGSGRLLLRGSNPVVQPVRQIWQTALGKRQVPAQTRQQYLIHELPQFAGPIFVAHLSVCVPGQKLASLFDQSRHIGRHQCVTMPFEGDMPRGNLIGASHDQAQQAAGNLEIAIDDDANHFAGADQQIVQSKTRASSHGIGPSLAMILQRVLRAVQPELGAGLTISQRAANMQHHNRREHGSRFSQDPPARQ